MKNDCCVSLEPTLKFFILTRPDMTLKIQMYFMQSLKKMYLI